MVLGRLIFVAGIGLNWKSQPFADKDKKKKNKEKGKKKIICVRDTVVRMRRSIEWAKSTLTARKRHAEKITIKMPNLHTKSCSYWEQTKLWNAFSSKDQYPKEVLLLEKPR